MLGISRSGLELIKHFEGTSLTPYLDVAGYPTIGTGHLITPEDAKKFAGGITQEQADNLLKRDLLLAEAAVRKLIRVKLTQGQFDALVSFVFNLGAGRLRSSTMRMKLNRGDTEGAANEFPKWCYSGGKKIRGLLRRRLAEKSMFAG